MSTTTDTNGILRLVRTFAVLGIAGALQLAFIGSYAGALHKLVPHRVPVDVVAPAAVVSKLSRSLNKLPGDPLESRIAPSAGAARADVLARPVYGYFKLVPGGRNVVAIASAANKATAVALTTVFDDVASRQHEPSPTVTDLAPLPASDPNGVSGFYAMVG